LLIVTGIHENGYREILGAKIEDNEDEPVWESLFEEASISSRLPSK
jgi:transposase-like protein